MARPRDIERGSPPLEPDRTTLVDPGGGIINCKRGFAAVAEKIVFDPDRSTTIYRRFDKLSARNLLFYQAELAELEELQDKYDEEDCNEKDAISKECQRDWLELKKRATEGREREKARFGLCMEIREKVERYHAALGAHQILLNSQLPSQSTVTAMRNWFLNINEETQKPGISQLWGASEKIYDDINDLVALHAPPDQDRLSTFIQNSFGIFFMTSRPENGQAIISHRRLSRFVTILSTILASVLLFGAIISLYIVKNQNALLGMVSGWTVLFAACVGLLTNAKRDQVFAGTAAYAAVLVVFVSGNLAGPSTCTCIGA
ncbi:hypothetical protein GLAREA_12168 [Glarea lozoyensis ATCC 20868]|uniref:DUF6594 domain-containing protein n=1 Tax=Glarea lozoyensis (strain ATCC 20868 / MF5171) TaxID=1116229 RepID=S3DJ70_GLAL2|nr:uncharacterized protein GLAREA_12168 [Glarea lozoyensis ATCC 20868]EPE32086.1 hypothetical protein GLAREA_12168 [Glarea lozoyensis ATCC 20868]